jgi:hypothetical protein
MKNNINTFAQSSLLQSFQSLELHNPYHLPDFQPFSFELKAYSNRIRSIALAFFILGLLAISTTSSFQLWQLQPSISAENALLETAQGMFLLLTASLQGLRALTSKNSGLERDIRYGLALFALLLFLREVDIDKIGISPHWALLEKTLRGVALLLTLRFTVHLFNRQKVIMANLARLVWSPTLLVSLLGCLFYASGWPFDKELFNIDKSLSLWYEETLELNACLLLLCASFTKSVKSCRDKHEGALAVTARGYI